MDTKHALVLCGESEEDPRVMVGHFIEVCKRRSLKVNAGKSKVMVIGGEDGFLCEVCIYRICLKHVSGIEILGMCFGQEKYR